jgi:hypothetical protein
VNVRVDRAGEREEAGRVDLGLGIRRPRLDERADLSLANEDVALVRAVRYDDRAADGEIGPRTHSSVMLKS